MSSEKTERAKIFAPFDCLKGFREALAQKERIIVPRSELSEESKEELDRRLRQIKKNDIITVIYFRNGEYIKITGMVSSLELTSRILKIINTKILFDDIYEIQGDFFDT
ncbi:YolD-like family protein [Clostridium transplantifaecale]|uniref:YolD-like family protein n=1 Tax=Clostridium transplantifaecale TaxID=2479838 RepID=UPI000F636B43|nr:YolD-like family protein [Clostridium transplantifaecale]